MLVRLAIAALGAAAVIGVLLAALAWLSYRDPGTATISDVDNTAMFTSWFQRRRSPAGFEVVDRGVIVPVDAAPELFRVCSRSSIDPVDGYWRPTASMIREIEARLPALLSGQSVLDPLDSYARQYAGVVSGGRQIVYGSFVSAQRAGDWQREVVMLCGGGRAAFGVEFDVATRTFGALQVDALL